MTSRSDFRLTGYSKGPLAKPAGPSRSQKAGSGSGQTLPEPNRAAAKRRLTSFLSKLESSWLMFNRGTKESEARQSVPNKQAPSEGEGALQERLKQARSKFMTRSPQLKGSGAYLKGSGAPLREGQLKKESTQQPQTQTEKAPSNQSSSASKSPTPLPTPKPGGRASSKAFLATSSAGGAVLRESTASGKPGAPLQTDSARQPVFSQSAPRVSPYLTQRHVEGSMPVHMAFLDERHQQQSPPSGLRLGWKEASRPRMSRTQRIFAQMARLRFARQSGGGQSLGNHLSLASTGARADVAGRVAGNAIGSMLKKLYDEEELEELDEDTAVSGLGLILRLGGEFTYEHSTRVLDLALDLADEVGVQDRQTRKEIEHGAIFKDIGEFDMLLQGGSPVEEMGDFLASQRVLQGGLLHDIGKVKIPPEILYKPGKLTPEEYELVKMHPIWGEEIVRPIAALRYLCPTIRHHHERWDGKGYPDGLAGEDIPLAARIIAVADVFDALSTDRPYKRGMELEKVELILEEGRGTHFDPELVDAFLVILERRYPNEEAS